MKLRGGHGDWLNFEKRKVGNATLLCNFLRHWPHVVYFIKCEVKAFDNDSLHPVLCNLLLLHNRY